MVELKLKEAQECLERIAQLSRLRDKEYAGMLDGKQKEVSELEKTNRRLTADLNDSVIKIDKHDQENARILFAGLVFGAIVGAIGVILWMG